MYVYIYLMAGAFAYHAHISSLIKHQNPHSLKRWNWWAPLDYGPFMPVATMRAYCAIELAFAFLFIVDGLFFPFQLWCLLNFSPFFVHADDFGNFLTKWSRHVIQSKFVSAKFWRWSVSNHHHKSTRQIICIIRNIIMIVLFCLTLYCNLISNQSK